MNYKSSTPGRIALATCIIFIFVIPIFISACSYSSSNAHSATSNSVTQKSDAISSSSSQSKLEVFDKEERSVEQGNKAYEEYLAQRKQESLKDPLWPTTNPELLAIPEESRWYNAASHVGTTCTIAGPVVDVYQATNEMGAPIFVSIGTDYPDTRGVTLVIWSEYLSDFEEMLYDVDHGGGWIEVTGYLDLYNGYMQFNTDTPGSFRWWAPS